MTYDPDRPDHATDPGPARRRKWGARLIWPALLLLAIVMATHPPKAIGLVLTVGVIVLSLAATILLLPWPRSNRDD